MPGFTPLTPDDFVYIAIRRKSYMDETGAIKMEAFWLRKSDIEDDPEEPDEPKGISLIFRHPPPTIDDVQNLTGLTKVLGIDQIRVGDIEALGLKVARGKEEWKAYLVGLPYVDTADASTSDEILTRRDELSFALASPNICKRVVRL